MTNNYPYPVTGQKNAQGYTWNGSQYVSPGGYAQGSAEDKKSKGNPFSRALDGYYDFRTKPWEDSQFKDNPFVRGADFFNDVLGDVGSKLTKPSTWANPAGDRPGETNKVLGILSGINRAFNPVQSIGSGVQATQEGRYLDAAQDLGSAAFKVFSLIGPGRAVGTAVKQGARGPQVVTEAIKNMPLVGKWFTGLTAPVQAKTVVDDFNEGYRGNPQRTDASGSSGMGATSAPATRDMSMTADQMERRAAMERNRTDAAGNSGMGGRNTVYTDGVRPPGGYPGAPGVPGAAVPAPLDLAPLDPDQLSSTGQSLVMLEKVYQDALNQYGLREKQGQQGYVQDVQSARRQATGAAQDLSTQLAASGMANSPAAAFAAGQMADAPRQARETAARKTLDQLLAEITTGRTQAGTQRDMDKLMINQMISDYRTKNTFANQSNAYGRLAGN
jgi:hypothetical protein